MATGAGVLFDVDGTLLDTNYLHVLAWCRALRSRGHQQVSMADVHRAIGIDSAGLIHRLTGANSDDPEGRELSDAHTEEYEKVRDEVRAFPAAADLVRRCQDAGLTVVLATSGGSQDLDWMLPAIGAGDALAGAVTADNVAAGKPSPDLQHAGMKKYALDPKRTVTVGDTVWDIESAGKAGLPCLALESGGIAREALESAGAHRVYRDPADLLDSFDDSILARVATATDDRSRTTLPPDH